jgi:fermentation-respiration switch protein FrsA (DUF1100 family)
MRWTRKVLIVVVGSLYAVLIGLALVSDRLIFQPQPASYADQEQSQFLHQLNPPGQLVKIRSGDQQITGLSLPNPQAKYTLLFSHGNAEDIGDDLIFFRMYRDARFAVFAYDYRGYGTSTGRPSEQGVYEDATAAYNFVTQQLHVPPATIISMGRSVGCAPAIHIAATQKVAGLIAEAPFMSAFRVLTRVPLLPWDKFNNLSEIKKVGAPVLIIHGRNDQVVPFWHGERVFQNANAPKQFVAVEGAGHNDVLFVAGKKYFGSLQQFAASLQ